MLKERKSAKGLKSVAEVLDAVKAEIGVKFKETASKAYHSIHNINVILPSHIHAFRLNRSVSAMWAAYLITFQQHSARLHSCARKGTTINY